MIAPDLELELSLMNRLTTPIIREGLVQGIPAIQAISTTARMINPIDD